MMLMADITDRKTGKKVDVPVSKYDAHLLKEFAYWRAFFYRVGQGIPPDLIQEKALKAAADSDYSMDRGKIVWRSE